MIKTPKKRKKKSKNYFTKDTENSIILYNKTSDHKIRSKIYGDNIHYPFFKLTENIIHTFKFYYTDVDNLEHLQHEIIVFLLSKIHLYSHKQNLQDRLIKIITKEFKEEYNKDFVKYIGKADIVTQEQINNFILNLNVSEECMEKLKKLTPPKAFSYFGTIVKRWLILYNDGNYKKKIQKVDVSELFKENTKHFYTIKNESIKNDLDIFLVSYINYCDKNLLNLFPKKNDVQVADAILELFRKREYIEIFNKKALYMSIRETMALNGLEVKTPKITKIADKLKKIFNLNYNIYLETGYTKFSDY